MGSNFLKVFKKTGLTPNWDIHDASKCLIINYFANRNNTALTKQEDEIGKTVKDSKN